VDRNFHFLVNNTNTSGHKSRHKEQQGSLTYYALTKQHKVSLAVEATKNCSLPEAIAFLTIAVNSALEEAGIQPDPPPSEDFLMISREMKEKRRGKIVSVSSLAASKAAPGMVRTDFSKLFWSTPAILDQIVKTIPAGRIAEPADVVYPVLLLCSPYADYITGQTVLVDGGATAI
jgi:NAD(P)-dependent dehydrogenase (short-subunit alcohol dehydrogenase family)